MRTSGFWSGFAAAAAIGGLWGSPAAAQPQCEDPSTYCGAKITPECQRLGAGSLSLSCGMQFTSYRECLRSVAEQCPTGPATETVTAGTCSEAKADRAWAIAESRKTCGAYQAFLRACPNDPLAAFAENEISALGCEGGGRTLSGGAVTSGGGVGGGVATGARRPGARFKECDACPEMVTLGGGAFRMGSPDTEEGRRGNEGPVRQIRVAPFALSRTEVSRGEYRRFIRETGRSIERCFAYQGGTEFGWVDTASYLAPGWRQTDEHPAVCVSYDDAQAYVSWLNSKVSGNPYRLPSEAELEYAIRAGSAQAFPWGSDPNGACATTNGADFTAQRSFTHWRAVTCDDGTLFTAPVGTRRANAFGLHDMVGNTYAWASDCWNDSLTNAPVDGRARSDGLCDQAPIRGGSWDNRPDALRAAFRAPYPRRDRAYFIGLRVAREAPAR